MTIELTTRRPATIVPESRREKFLPVLFGFPMMIVAESAVYSFMSRLSPRDYGGGFWNTPIDLDASIAQGGTVLVESMAYTEQNPAYFRTDIR